MPIFRYQISYILDIFQLLVFFMFYKLIPIEDTFLVEVLRLFIPYFLTSISAKLQLSSVFPYILIPQNWIGTVSTILRFARIIRFSWQYLLTFQSFLFFSFLFFVFNSIGNFSKFNYVFISIFIHKCWIRSNTYV